MASGPRNCPMLENCSTMPLPVAMCCDEGACTGKPAKIEAGITPAQGEKKKTSAERKETASSGVSKPISQKAAMTHAPMTRGPGGPPPAGGQPPPGGPG